MDFLFIVVIVAVIAGAGWALTRKLGKNIGWIGGGGSSGDETDNDGTVNPPKTGPNEQ